MSFMGNKSGMRRGFRLLTVAGRSAILCLQILQSIFADAIQFIRVRHRRASNFPAEKPCPGLYWGPLVISVLVLLWFYGFEMRYGSNRAQSALDWLWSAWNGENDYEHGPLFPLIIAGLVVHRFKSLKAAAEKGSGWGLVAVVVGRDVVCGRLPHAPAAGGDRRHCPS